MRALKTRMAAVIVFVLAVAALSGAAGWFGYLSALDQVAQRGRSDLALASDRLTGELQRYRELAVLMADHPDVMDTVAGTAGDAGQLLRETADKTGSLDIIIVDAGGSELASASDTTPEFHGAQPYFERALDGALGIYHRVQDRYGRRTFLFAAPVFSDPGPVAGAVIVVVNVDAVESVWRGARPTVFFTDELGVVFVSNRSELIYQARDPAVAAQGLTADYADGLMRPFMSHTALERGGVELWRVDGQRYIPTTALHLTLELPVIQMTGEALIDVAPAQVLGQLQGLVTAAICLAFGAMLFLATERRRALAEANARLETAVEARTAALAQAQADLVQAGKLSALGQMSAGISHELNQPLMAIQSYAENAESYLERGKPDVAGQNLGRIADLARRMGRIIRNLRAFAKQESEGLTDVELGSVVDAVLEITGPRAKAGGVTIRWMPSETGLFVRGGEVRLQQVVLNLVSNAMDAMEGQSAPMQIEIEAQRLGPRIELSVRDNGPGLTEPDRIFDPFYSTKQVDQDGMGLGLSISYGLVQSFGGDIRGRNHPDGGAVFTIELDAAMDVREAAE
ncbi:MAG: ATP-binding protein [Pseudomonadota bacterium]